MVTAFGSRAVTDGLFPMRLPFLGWTLMTVSYPEFMGRKQVSRQVFQMVLCRNHDAATSRINRRGEPT